MSKKFLRGGIFKHGFLEPLGIKFEGLDSLFHRSELFIQIHFGMVWQIMRGITNENYSKLVKFFFFCSSQTVWLDFDIGNIFQD